MPATNNDASACQHTEGGHSYRECILGSRNMQIIRRHTFLFFKSNLLQLKTTLNPFSVLNRSEPAHQFCRNRFISCCENSAPVFHTSFKHALIVHCHAFLWSFLFPLFICSSWFLSHPCFPCFGATKLFTSIQSICSTCLMLVSLLFPRRKFEFWSSTINVACLCCFIRALIHVSQPFLPLFQSKSFLTESYFLQVGCTSKNIKFLSLCHMWEKCTLCPDWPVYAALLNNRWHRYELISCSCLTLWLASTDNRVSVSYTVNRLVYSAATFPLIDSKAKTSTNAPYHLLTGREFLLLSAFTGHLSPHPFSACLCWSFLYSCSS